MRKKYQSKKISRATKITVIFIIALLFMSIGYSRFERTLNVGGTSSLIIAEEEAEDEGFIDFTPPGTWGAGGGMTVYQFAAIDLGYTGQEITNGWEVVFAVPSDSVLTACWDAVCTLDGNRLTVRNNNNNGAIQPGSAPVRIGFQINTAVQNYQLNMQSIDFFTASNPNPNEVLITDGLVVTLRQTGGWSQSPTVFAASYTLDVRNDTGSPIQSWEVALNRSPDMRVASLWSGQFVQRENLIIITPESWTSIINPGATVSVGMQIDRHPDTEVTISHFFGRGL